MAMRHHLTPAPHALLPGWRALRRVWLPLLAAVTAMLTLAPAAMAISPTDSQFLAAWHAEGLYASSDQAAIGVGHAIVDYLDDQPTFDSIDHLVDDIVHATDGEGGLVHYTYYEAGEQIYLAVYFYGPQHLPLLNAYTNANNDQTPPPPSDAGSPGTTLA